MESSNEAIWDTFQQERLPRFVQHFQALLGTDHPIEIDWTSLGVEHNNYVEVATKAIRCSTLMTSRLS